MAVVQRPVTERALDALRLAGNPFRNFFARNPDDEYCARYHVSQLYAAERAQLLSVVDLFRNDPSAHSEVIPVLGNKGSGKTHLLHSIKHGTDNAGHVLVTPGVYQKDTDFLEYLLFQTVDTLLGGTRQRGQRPIEIVGDELTRRILARAFEEIPDSERSHLMPSSGLGRWTRMLGLGSRHGATRFSELAVALTSSSPIRPIAPRVQRLVSDSGLDIALACEIGCRYVQKIEAHSTTGLMRRAIFQGLCKATLMGDEASLADFLTNGFAELPFHVRPTRQDLVLSLFKVLMEVFRGLKLPVVVAFDQLEDLLLARRSDDGHKVAESFFAGIVHAMHQIDGLCFLIFAERGLWNRFIPSLDGYIQDRLNNPVHVAGYGTISELRLESPDPSMVMQVVEARLAPTLTELFDSAGLNPLFPFTEEQVIRIARTEPTLRDMLQQFRILFDRIVFTKEEAPAPVEPANRPINRIPPVEQANDEMAGLTVKSMVVIPEEEVEAEALGMAEADEAAVPLTIDDMRDLWEQEQRIAYRKLEPEGALQGAARELQAGLGTLLQTCQDHGVKVGPWRLQHVVSEWSFGDHPAYGVLTIAHWVCRDAQPWKVGIGFFLSRGGGKPKDLEVKLAAFDVQPAVIDHLILLRPDDDLVLTGKSKAMWQEAERTGKHSRIEAIGLDGFANIASFPRWLAAMSEAMPASQKLPNLADLIQDKCERILEQVCMPIQG